MKQEVTHNKYHAPREATKGYAGYGNGDKTVTDKQMKLTKHEKKTLNGLLHKILALRDRKCLRCGKSEYQMSHIYNKGRYRAMEFDPDNVKALCYACHLHFWHKSPIEAAAWIKTVLPKERLDRLKLASQVSKGRFDYKLHKLFLESEIKKLSTK